MARQWRTGEKVQDADTRASLCDFGETGMGRCWRVRPRGPRRWRRVWRRALQWRFDTGSYYIFKKRRKGAAPKPGGIANVLWLKLAAWNAALLWTVEILCQVPGPAHI